MQCSLCLDDFNQDWDMLGYADKFNKNPLSGSCSWLNAHKQPDTRTDKVNLIGAPLDYEDKETV
jgi:hypothetical protein